ncbi:MAG: hypothetical protein ACREQQ_11475 [Candidatus Binatia bacterium]
MPIYLHELVDVVPGRAGEYCDSMAEHHGASAARAGRTDGMLGLWTSIEAAGTWPLGVNIWQYGSWSGVEAQLGRQFEPRAQDPKLKAWWLANLGLRTGGFDRLIESTDYTLDVEGLRRRGAAGTLFLHQIVSLSAGKVGDYLAAFGAEGTAAAEAHGATLVGAYRVLLRSDEAITLLAFSRPADFARFQKSWYDESTALGRWRQREDAWVRGKEALVLKPRYFLRSPWHP